MPKGGPDFYYFWSRKGARFANLLLHSASSLFTLFTLFFSCIFVLCKMWQILVRGLVTASPSRVIDCTTFNLQFLPPTSHGEAGRERRRGPVVQSSWRKKGSFGLGRVQSGLLPSSPSLLFPETVCEKQKRLLLDVGRRSTKKKFFLSRTAFLRREKTPEVAAGK